MTAALSATDRAHHPSATQSAESPQDFRQWFTTANNEQRVAGDVCAGQSHFSAPIGSSNDSRKPCSLFELYYDV
jgi:hypothetical protein